MKVNVSDAAGGVVVVSHCSGCCRKYERWRLLLRRETFLGSCWRLLMCLDMRKYILISKQMSKWR